MNKIEPLLLIYSGGMDSTTALYEFRDSIKLCLSFDYRSKHNTRELAEAAFHTTALGIPHQIINLAFIGDHFRSSLLQNGSEIPEGHYRSSSMKQTVVPFRNGIMLSIAAGIAESNRLGGVMIANHFGDHTIYPDCRNSFIEPMRSAIKAGTDSEIELVAPYTFISKRAIALKGRALGIDFSRTWSCYKGGEKHCGRCGTCIERKEALVGFDLTEYENHDALAQAV
ncbi:MAG: 7-cyano-7-deazaguanine synthase QueC [Bdellovibrionales bacterium]|nr:7-cyano-7-deazaguanine synthase QueC [Bdellovibrionales bacterium]